MKRLTFFRVFLMLVLALLASRLYQLQFVHGDERQYGDPVEINTTRYIPVPPRRGEILASDGETLLAESVPAFSIAVMPGNLPELGTDERAQVLGSLAHIAEMSGTVTISPALSLRERASLREDLGRVVEPRVLEEQLLVLEGGITDMVTCTFVLPITRDVVEVVQDHAEVLSLDNPIESMVDPAHTPYYESVVIKPNVSEELALAVQENARHLPGAVVVDHYQRRYPKSKEIPSLSHVLGYIGRINECELVQENPATSWVESLGNVIGHSASCGLVSKRITSEERVLPPYQNDDYIGKDGLEASYEDYLRGELGVDALFVDALERPVSGRETREPVQDGHNLVLTIDAGFQLQTEQILRRWLAVAEARRRQSEDYYKREYKPITSGVVIVMNPNNGNILAMVNLPAYDNNIWVNSERSGELRNLLSPSDAVLQQELERLSPLTNRAISGLYPPGSTLKPFVGATALQKGVIAANTHLRDPGKIVLEERGGHRFVLPNSDPRDHGEITISDALKVSSNVFFASIAGGNDQAVNLDDDDYRTEGMSIDGLTEGFDWFGLGELTHIRLPGEATGRVPDPIWKSYTLREPWTTGDTYNTVIGQGFLEVTPLQVVVGMTAVANGGTVYRPKIVQAVTDTRGQVVEEVPTEVLMQVPVEPGHFAVIREGMRRSVTEGLNVAARDGCSGLSIAGKTGTAEFGPLILNDEGGYARRSHAWFVGFAPYEDPELIVVALLEGSGDLEDGSSTLAVPAVTEVMQTYFQVEPPEDRPPMCP